MIELSISQIQALTGSLPDNVFFTTDDNQQGLWEYDPSDTTSLENIGTIILTSDGKRIKRVYDGPVNVKWFGLPTLSASFNTTTLNMIFSNFTAVYIPAGYYLCNKLTIDQNNLVVTSNNAVLMMNVSSPSLAGQLLEVTGVNVQIQNVIFDGGSAEVLGCLCTIKPKASHGPEPSVYFDHCTFKNIHGKGLANGGMNQLTNNQYAVVVSLYKVKFGFNNCIFKNIYNENKAIGGNGRPYIGGGFTGAIYFGQDDFQAFTEQQIEVSSGYITNCYFQDIITILSDNLDENDKYDFNDADCIRTYGDAIKANRLNLTVSNCIFKNYSKRGIKISDTDNLIVTNCRYIIDLETAPEFLINCGLVSMIDIRANNIFIDNMIVESDLELRHIHLIAIAGQKNIAIRNVFADYAGTVILINQNPRLTPENPDALRENFTFYNVSCENVFSSGIIQSTDEAIEMKSWTIEKFCVNGVSDCEGETVPCKGLPAISLFAKENTVWGDGLFECRFSDINITNGFVKLVGREYTLDKLTMTIDSENYGIDYPSSALMELQLVVSGQKNNVVVENVLIKVKQVDGDYYNPVTGRTNLIYFNFDYTKINNFRLLNLTGITSGYNDIYIAGAKMVNNYNLQYQGNNGMFLNGTTFTAAQISNVTFYTDSSGAIGVYTNIT